MSNTPRKLNEIRYKAQNYALEQSSKNLEKVVENAIFLSHCVKKKVLRGIDVENINKKQKPSDKVKILTDRLQQFPVKYLLLLEIMKRDPTGQYCLLAQAIETDKTEKEDSIAVQSLTDIVSEMSEILTGRKINSHKYQSLTHIVSLLPDLIHSLKELKSQKEAAENTKERFEQAADKTKEESEELQKLSQTQAELIQEQKEQEKELKRQIEILENQVQKMKEAKESEITNRDNWIRGNTCANCKRKFTETGQDSHRKTSEKHDTKVTSSDYHDNLDPVPVHSQSSHTRISYIDNKEDATIENLKLKRKQSSPGEEDGSGSSPETEDSNGSSFCEEDGSGLISNHKIFTPKSFNMLQGTWPHNEANETMDILSTHNAPSVVPGSSSPGSSVVDYISTPSQSFLGISGSRTDTAVHVRDSSYVKIIKNVYHIHK